MVVSIDENINNVIMEICLYEYDVTSNSCNQDELIIKIDENGIIYNDKGMNSIEVINKAPYLLDSCKDLVLK